MSGNIAYNKPFFARAPGPGGPVFCGNPVESLFTVCFKQVTNFAIKDTEITFNDPSGCDFGRRVTATMNPPGSTQGDLIYRTQLQITLPEINQTDASFARWLDFPGEQIISSVEVEIGGQRIDKHYGDWMHIWNQLTMPSDKEENYHKMIGHTTNLTYVTDPSGVDLPSWHSPVVDREVNGLPCKGLPEHTLKIPLQFWFCRNPGLAIPLKKIPPGEFKIILQLRPIDECLWAVNSLDPQATNRNAQAAYNKSLVAASLYCESIYLDEKESKRFELSTQEYFIEQLQFTGDESVGSSVKNILLNFNGLQKELIWVVQPDAHVNYAATRVYDPSYIELSTMLGAQPFNYTSHIDLLSRSPKAYFRPGFVKDWAAQSQNLIETSFGKGATIDCSGALDLFERGGWSDGATIFDNTTAASTSDSVSYINMQTSRKQNCWGYNPVLTAKLRVDGQDRFSEREGSYFDQVQPYLYHSRGGNTGINVFSFALHPEENQPTGTMEMGIGESRLDLILAASVIDGTKVAKVRVYATSYNILRLGALASPGTSRCKCLPPFLGMGPSTAY